jgi:hypothetical protein
MLEVAYQDRGIDAAYVAETPSIELLLQPFFKTVASKDFAISSLRLSIAIKTFSGAQHKI